MNMSIEEFKLEFNLFLVLVNYFWTWTMIASYVVNFVKD